MGVENIAYTLSDHSLLMAKVDIDKSNTKISPKEMLIMSLINNPK